MKTKSLPLSAVFLLLFIIIGVEIAGAYLFFHIFPKPSDLEILWFTGALRILDLGLILSFVYLSGRGTASIGIIHGELMRGIFIGLWWSLLFGAAVFSLWGVFLIFRINLFRFLFSQATHISPPLFIWLILIGGILAPIVEDSFFIGGLYNAFRNKFPPLVSALSTSLFFALLHGLHGSFPVTQFIGGLLFALSFEYSKSLLTPVSIHILGNCTLFVMSYCTWLKDIFLALPHPVFPNQR